MLGPLEVSVVGLGCNNFGGRIGAEETRAVVEAALEAGITFFDTAAVYGGGKSEELLGEILEGRRDQAVIATKFAGDRKEPGRGSRASLRREIQVSLERLRTDWVDLYQYHWPDAETPLEETLEALHELVEEGTVRAIGSSNSTPEMVEEAHAIATERGLTPFVSEQSQYSWLRRDAERELLPACRRVGVSFIPYFPLASGLLTGKYRRGEPAPEGTRLQGRAIEDADHDAVEELESFAQERGLALLEVAIGGLAAVPGVVSVIAGATRPDQARANAAAGAWEPSADELAALHAFGG